MTIIVNVTVPEGMVLSADSRQTFKNNNGDVRVSSDSARKLFQLNKRIGAATSGWAYLDGRSINSHVNDFKLTLANAEIPVAEMAISLGEYLSKAYQDGIDHGVSSAVDENNYAVGMLVGGYDPGGKQGSVYEVYVPKAESFLLRTTNEKPGSLWRGYTPVITRLLRGFDSRISEMPGYSEELGKALDDGKLGYLVDYWSMTLQDAIDYSLFLVHTTIEMQRFSDGVILSPGGSVNCGGPIDVAVIDPEAGFQWVRSKQLHASDPYGVNRNAET
jgi:20S proteasome alpha/beta subunit